MRKIRVFDTTVPAEMEELSKIIDDDMGAGAEVVGAAACVTTTPDGESIVYLYVTVIWLR